jgi:predicted RND superfamily exporter protein
VSRAFEVLAPLLRFAVTRPLALLALAATLAALGLFGASRLTIDTDLANLIPEDYPSVQALERLRETVGGESTVDVAVESDAGFAANRAFADAFIPRVLALTDADGQPYFTRVEYQRDTSFLAQNGLYFATEAELDQLEFFLEDEIEAARLEANPFFVDPLDDFDDLEDDGEDGDDVADVAESLEEIGGREYLVSDDSTVLAMRFTSASSQSNIRRTEELYAALDETIAAVNPGQFAPDMEVTTSGRMWRQVVEVRTITDDVAGSFGLGVTAVLLLVVGYFLYKALQARTGGFGTRVTGAMLLQELARTPILALVVAIPLLMSLSWAFGLASVVFGELNLMTSTLGLVLFGLGIDYGIHFYARYAEERGAGRVVIDAAETTFHSTGQAIAVSAFTTAAALFVLTIADFRGFSEFGFIGGTGILFALVSMLFVMPALLSLFERIGLLKLGGEDVVARASVAAPGMQGKRVPAPKAVVIGSLVAVAVALALLPSVSFQYNFNELEPTYTDYNARRASFSEAVASGGRRNPAYVIADTPAEVPGVVAALQEVAERDTLVLAVESLQERFPTTEAAAQAKLARIADIRALADDPFLQQDTTGQIARLRRAASTPRPIALEEVPDDLRKRFTTKTGEVGTFVMVYPSASLGDGRLSMRFADLIGEVEANGKTYYAGSTSIVAASMLSLLIDEAPLMVGLTFLLIALLMWVEFRSVKWASLALLPLVVGVLWMLGLMELFNIRLTFYNLIVLPAVLGIGNDCGVHLIHRYREQGPGSIRRVLRSTGEHVTMGALTTMIGFAGLTLSFHPGLQSIGLLAVVGIGATLLAALVFLPALLQWIEDRGEAEPSVVGNN